MNVKGNNVNLTWVSTTKAKLFTLPEGHYVLTETLPNAGYELNTQSISFEVKDGKVTQQVIHNKLIEKPVIKKMLPTTGDTKLDIIVLVTGLLLMIGACLYIRKKRLQTK